MKNKIDTSVRGLKTLLLAITLAIAAAPVAQASTDYGPAVWKPNCGQFYTSGKMHDFQVLHSLEGYYLASIAYFQLCGTASSMHYLVNATQDASSDAAPGETTQMVREAYWAWHASCWATYMFGTGHEGFRSNPAWQTTRLYSESAVLTRHLADTRSFAKDRNHIISDTQGSNSAWVLWLGSNYPAIDPSCNSAAGLGAYFDWNSYMNYVKGTVVDNSDAGFSASANWLTGNSPAAYGGSDRYRPTAAINDVATWSTTTAAGKYQVSAYWPQSIANSPTAPYLISTSTGTQTIVVNQGLNGSQWNVLGTFTLASGTNTVKLSCWTTTGYFVVADAVKWLKVSDF